MKYMLNNDELNRGVHPRVNLGRKKKRTKKSPACCGKKIQVPGAGGHPLNPQRTTKPDKIHETEKRRSGLIGFRAV